MSYPITINHIVGLPQIPYRNGVGNYEGVVCHSTANNNDTDEGEHNYEQNTFQNAFVHYFVDSDSITETAPTNYLAWHAGHTANERYVGVELCQPTDQLQFQQAYDRYVWLVAKLLADKKLGVKDGVTLLSHKQTSDIFRETNHTDPIEYLASHGVSWSQHVTNVTNAYNGIIAPVQAQLESHISKTYVVQPNETLYEISRKFGTTPEALQHLNGLTSTVIHPGQILNVSSQATPQPVIPKSPPAIPQSTPVFAPLSVGSKGEDVKFVQRFLGITADGIYGEQTKAAVVRYQNMRGLTPDGVVGPLTWANMHS